MTVVTDNAGHAAVVLSAAPAGTEAALAVRLVGGGGGGGGIVEGMGTPGVPLGGVLTVQGAVGNTPLPVSATALPLPTGAATEATLATRLAEATFTGRINTQGQKPMATSTPIVIASDQSAVAVTSSPSTTGAGSSVAASVTVVTLLAANASRKGATVYNDSTGGTLSVFLGAGASATLFTVKLSLGATIGGYYEVPFAYNGIVTGIWDVASGSARVTELT